MKDKLVDIDGRIVHETDKAYLFDHGGNENVWLPKSVVEWDADTRTMTMPESWALDKGLI